MVLEFGSYKGVMTEYMKNVLGCKVYICELDSAALAIAKQYAEDYWQGDLETLGWTSKFKDIKFDYIICADVLEHLKDPDTVLKATSELLKDEGSVLLSIPNIAHNSVICGLMKNEFEYRECGILDKTHLRFFTYSSLKQLCAGTGYTPVEEDATYEFFAQTMSGESLNKRYGNVLQFVFELKKSEYAKKNKIDTVYKITSDSDDAKEELPIAGQPSNEQPSDGQKSDLKFIAFYLPQFHKIKENDEWWGEGFTEWTNTQKAVPLFEGHKQPREPLDDYYYDLADIQTLKWQSELMRDYHIHGLCFYHYWFNGKLLLEKPMELLLEHKEIQINYCISWANEPWTRNWDGGSSKILVDQDYGNKEDWKKHFDYLLPFFKDERYIKIDNKPVFTIYLSNGVSCGREMMQYWRQLARENGFSGLYVAETVNAKQNRVCLPDSDACIEFEPCVTLFGGYTPWNGHYFYKSLHLFFYEHVWNRILERNSTYGSREKFCGAFVDWDNTPRVGMKGSVCIGATPEKFRNYLRRLVQKCIREKNDRFIFINAWNEWCEGAYLEPDKDNSYKYLEAVREISEEIRQ